jgi:putative ABC transport system permease protein
MNLIEAIRISFTALRANPLRSLLTMLGIIIGVGAVIAMLAIGNGFSVFLNQQFDRLGSGSFYVYPGAISRKVSSESASQLTAAGADAIMQPGAAPAVEQVAVIISSNFAGVETAISAGDRRANYNVSGVTPNYFQILTNELSAGRFYTDIEERDAARVAVIGRKVADRLFDGDENALGQRVTVNGVQFEVIGVIKTDSSFGPNPNPAEWIFTPYNTAKARLFRNNISSRVDVSQLTIKARDKTNVPEAIRQATAVLRTEHRLTYQDNNFTIINPDQIAASFQQVIGGFNAFLILVAGISLLVGGIGISNIMLVSVAERTREIGLRKAVGARRGAILTQFLIEAIVLCMVGAVIGVGLGFALSGLGTFVLVNVFGAEGAVATVTLNAVVLAAGIATTIGVAFGFFPALQAARLRPIEALRYE